MIVSLKGIGGVRPFNLGRDVLVKLLDFFHSFAGLYTWLLFRNSRHEIKGA